MVIECREDSGGKMVPGMVSIHGTTFEFHSSLGKKGLEGYISKVIQSSEVQVLLLLLLLLPLSR
jgi:hypothetical protein